MIRIAIAGDFCPRHRLDKLIKNREYEQVLGDVKSFLSDFDLSVVNLEAPVTTLDETPIKKDGPCLKCNKNAVEALRYSGFHVATLANNHINDYGAQGVLNTLKTCEYYGIECVGAGENDKDAAEVKYLAVSDKIIALINCCEHEFSIATANQPGANHINPIRIFNQIRDAKDRSDYVIVITHGGHEHYQLPSPRMKELFRFFVDAGADAIINHHQHCISGYEVYKGKPIAYGIGNFCFDRVDTFDDKWNDGVIACLELEKDNIVLSLKPFVQCDKRIGVVFDVDSENRIMNHILELNKIIKHDELLKDQYESFLKKHKSHNLIFEPYFGRIASALYRRGYLPKIFSKFRTKSTMCYGFIMCESHLDIVKYNLAQNIHNK